MTVFIIIELEQFENCIRSNFDVDTSAKFTAKLPQWNAAVKNGGVSVWKKKVCIATADTFKVTRKNSYRKHIFYAVTWILKKKMFKTKHFYGQKEGEHVVQWKNHPVVINIYTACGRGETFRGRPALWLVHINVMYLYAYCAANLYTAFNIIIYRF